MAVITPTGTLKRALTWASQTRSDAPETPLYRLVDEAGMRFNLSPKECDALSRLLKGALEPPST